MFKAKLIEDRKFYRNRRVSYFFILMSSFPVIFVMGFNNISYWVTVPLFLFGLVGLYFEMKNLKLMQKMIGKRKIEIDETEIRITSNKGIVEESIKLNNDHSLILKEEYKIDGESVSDIKEEMKGNAQENVITIVLNNQRRDFHFLVDSYYMIAQLQKIIAQWKVSGYTVKEGN